MRTINILIHMFKTEYILFSIYKNGNKCKCQSHNKITQIIKILQKTMFWKFIVWNHCFFFIYMYIKLQSA